MSEKSDVCLIVEGTYPYVAGGVSSWIHQLISALSDVRFSLLIILPSRDYIREIKYKLPKNITEIKQVFIHDYEATHPHTRISHKKAQSIAELQQFALEMIKGDFSRFDVVYPCLTENTPHSLTAEDLIFSKPAWDMICTLYKHFKLTISFTDFFWTFRFSIMPLINLFKGQIPEASIYHAISTGYAGVLGVLGKLVHRGALMLTEHGIYTRERKIEIAQASWIYDERNGTTRPEKTLSFFKEWWIRYFDIMSIICYNHCNEIITLYEGNQHEQLKGGADPERVSIIPNGIDLKGKIPEQRTLKPDQTRFVIGLVGRVVPIKDIKTFIKACKIVLQSLPDAEFWVMGPTDEDEEYYNECVALRDMLDLHEKIIFTGMVNLKEYYPKIDLLVLTSESEAQPLVILEAHAEGIPAISSDVGSCREMLYGRTPEDKALGKGGLITGVGNPSETAEAIIAVLRNDEEYASMSVAGAQRVERFYNRNDLFAQYLNLYDKYSY